MTRLLVLACSLVTLHLGGASAVWHDAQSAYQVTHAAMNSLSTDVTSDLVNLHSSLGSGS